MQNNFCRKQFTFHSSWVAAMSYIRSNAVRNRLIAAIIEYGLNRRHTPVGNAVADAIMVLVMDQIDREGGVDDEVPSSALDGDILSPDGETVLGGEDDSEQPECGEDILEAVGTAAATETSSNEAKTDYDGDVPSSPVDIRPKAKQKSRSRKKKRQARRRKHRR